jgi:hypothetical protein
VKSKIPVQTAIEALMSCVAQLFRVTLTRADGRIVWPIGKIRCRPALLACGSLSLPYTKNDFAECLILDQFTGPETNVIFTLSKAGSPTAPKKAATRKAAAIPRYLARLAMSVAA